MPEGRRTFRQQWAVGLTAASLSPRNTTCPLLCRKINKGNWCFDVPTGASRRLLAAVGAHLLELGWVVTFRVSGAFVGTQAIDDNKAAATSEGF